MQDAALPAEIPKAPQLWVIVGALGIPHPHVLPYYSGLLYFPSGRVVPQAQQILLG